MRKNLYLKFYTHIYKLENCKATNILIMDMASIVKDKEPMSLK